MGIFHAFLDDAGVRLYGFEAGGDGVETGRHAARDRRRLAGRAARHAHLRAAGRGRPDDRDALDLGRPGLPGRRPRARLAARHRPGDLPAGRPTPRRWTPSRCSAGPRASSRRSSARTRSPARSRSAASSGPDAVAAGQPVRSRRQGHGHRRPAGSALARRATARRGERAQQRRRRTSRRRPRAARAGPRWSATCRPASRPSTGAIAAITRWSRPASTSSRSACPTPTR